MCITGRRHGWQAGSVYYLRQQMTNCTSPTKVVIAPTIANGYSIGGDTGGGIVVLLCSVMLGEVAPPYVIASSDGAVSIPA